MASNITTTQIHNRRKTPANNVGYNRGHDTETNVNRDGHSGHDVSSPPTNSHSSLDPDSTVVAREDGGRDVARDVALDVTRDRVLRLVRVPASASASRASCSWISRSLIGYRRRHLSSNMHGSAPRHSSLTNPSFATIPPNIVSWPSQSKRRSVCGRRPPGTPWAVERLW